MTNSSKRAMQMILGVIIPVAVILVVVASTLAQGPPCTELLDDAPTLFLPFFILRCVCWYTAYHGGRSWAMKRHCMPVCTMWRRPLNTSHSGWSPCGASSRMSVR